MYDKIESPIITMKNLIINKRLVPLQEALNAGNWHYAMEILNASLRCCYLLYLGENDAIGKFLMNEYEDIFISNDNKRAIDFFMKIPSYIYPSEEESQKDADKLNNSR